MASRLLAPAVVGVALTVGAWAVVDQWDEISVALRSLEWWSTPVAVVAGAAGVYAIYRSWASVVADHGIELQHHQSLRIYGIGQAGKYLPGSVWAVLTQAEMVREYGGSRARMASASLVALLLSVAVAVGLGALLLPFANTDAAHRYWFAPLVALALAVCLAPTPLNWLVARGARVLRRPLDAVLVTRGGILRATAWAVVGNLFFGLHLAALGSGVGLTGGRGFLLATSAYALAAGLGVLVVIAPAGAGVREVVITVVLGIAVTTGAALTIALLSRVVLLVVDLVFALSQLRATRTTRPRVIVFVTRRFPPSVGGMETLAAAVWRSICAATPDRVLLAHGGSNAALAWWLPMTWLRLGALLLRGRVAQVVVGDAPTYAALWPLLKVADVPSAVMVMGLDVTFDNRAYRAIVPRALRQARTVIAISEATKEASVEAGVPASRIAVLRLGVEPPESGGDAQESRRRLIEVADMGEAPVLLVTLGRLVRRKGVRWFVSEVLPSLPDRVHYLVAGDGPEGDLVRAAASEAGVQNRVHLLGRVDDALREDLMTGADLFVQPNIAVPGDMEGFGLVTVEAAMRDTLVLAADLEGIRDAVLHEQTGLLAPSGDAPAWIQALTRLTADPVALEAVGREYGAAARSLYSEESMAHELSRLLGLRSDSAPGISGT